MKGRGGHIFTRAADFLVKYTTPMKIDTLCVQGGYRPECGQPRQVPIVSSTTFKYDTTQHMAASST